MKYAASTAILSAILLAGCASSINLYTASTYAKGCHGWQAQDEWWKARKACGRAVVNAQLGGAPENSLAVLWYEYGRTSGAICDYTEAQRGLDEALKLDQKTGGPVYMSLLEMARLNMAQGKYADAAAYYEKFWQAVPMQKAESNDPTGMAEVLDEQAEAYRHIGKNNLANKQTARALQLRAANLGKRSNTDRTPYGQFCYQKS